MAHIEPMTLNVQVDQVAPFVLTGGFTTDITLQQGASLAGNVNLTGPQGEPSIKGFHGYCAGNPASSETIVAAIAPYDVTFTLAECKAEALVAANAETVFTLFREGVQIGTITFAAGNTVGTVALTAFAITKGELVTIVAPVNQDAALSDITFLLAS